MGETVEDDTGMMAKSAGDSNPVPSNKSSLASWAVTTQGSSLTGGGGAKEEETAAPYNSSSSASSSFRRAEKWIVTVSLDSGRWTWGLGTAGAGGRAAGGGALSAWLLECRLVIAVMLLLG